MPRQRSTVLSVLEAFRRTESSRPFHALLIFLYVCENEGVTVSELALLCQLQLPTAARILNMMAGFGDTASCGMRAPLIEFRESPRDKRLKFVHLSETGRTLCKSFDSVIASAVPIAQFAHA